jgi:hypothetical protein
MVPELGDEVIKKREKERKRERMKEGQKDSAVIFYPLSISFVLVKPSYYACC